MPTSREEQAQWVARHEASGQSLQSFCRDHNIPYCRMQYWVAQHRKRIQAVEDHEQPGFVELSAKSHSPQGSPLSIEIFMGPARCVLPVSVDPTIVVTIMRELSA